VYIGYTTVNHEESFAMTVPKGLEELPTSTIHE
jgi:hypothetical protein